MQRLQTKKKEWGVIFVDTIIELYDDEQIFNVISSTVLKPARVVFIGEKKLSKQRMQRKIRDYFDARAQDIAIEFMSINIYDYTETIAALEKTVKKHPDCVIDVTGGRDLVLLAVGMFCSGNDVPLLRYSRTTNSLMNIRNCPFAAELPFEQRITPEQFIILAGGAMAGHGHLNPLSLLPDTYDDIENAWVTFITHKKEWHRQVLYLQAASKIPGNISAGGLRVTAPLTIETPKSGSLRCNSDIMYHLNLLGLIKHTGIKGNQLSFEYKNEDIKRCMTDAGGWLEIYIYKTAKESGIFDSVELSMVVDWNGKQREQFDPLNEIDVILVKGITPILVSCKAGSFDARDINELRALATRFCGKNATAVFVTTDMMMANSPCLYKRAMEFGIEVIEYSDLVDGSLIEMLDYIAKKATCV